MLRRKKSAIKFAGRKHPVPGIISTGIGVISVIIGIVLVILSTRDKGNGGLYLGLGGFALVALTIAGIIVGAIGAKKEDIYYTFPVIGITVNGCLFVAMIALYFLGLSM